MTCADATKGRSVQVRKAAMRSFFTGVFSFASSESGATHDKNANTNWELR
jgi:hypothetical protein